MTPARIHSDTTDKDLVRRALEGDELAYREIVRRYERPVFSLVYRMVRDREKAEDISQEAFVKALNALDTYRPKYKFSSWIFKIANNTTIDHLRKKELDTLSLQGPAGPDAEPDARPLQIGTDAESPLEELEARELGSAIEEAIGQLRPEYRSCILLRYVEDMAYDEIAESLDLPLGTVKTYIHRARSELKELLSETRDT